MNIVINASDDARVEVYVDSTERCGADVEGVVAELGAAVSTNTDAIAELGALASDTQTAAAELGVAVSDLANC